MINKTINGYTFKYLIGTGGMADVYYTENSLGFRPQSKVLKKEYNHLEQLQERFVHDEVVQSTTNTYARFGHGVD